VRDEVWVAWVGDQSGKPISDAQATLRGSQQHHAAIGGESSAVKGGSDFLAPTAGNPNGSIVSSDMAGVAQRDRGNGWS
jgi:hypothetical protein